MALDAEPPGDDAKAEAAHAVKPPAATAKAKKARRKKVRRLCTYHVKFDKCGGGRLQWHQCCAIRAYLQTGNRCPRLMLPTSFWLDKPPHMLIPSTIPITHR